MTDRTDQIGAAEIKNMSPAQIVEAFDAGRLREYMAGRDEPEPEAEEPGPTPGGADQGVRGRNERMPDGLSYAAQQRWKARRFFAGKTYQEIAAMYDAGQLDEIMRDGFR